jgi:hypothetical protein
MTGDTSTFETDWYDSAEREGIGEITLASVVVESIDDEPDRCTIYDPNTEGFDRMSSWVTGEGAAFVDCRRHR